MSDEETLADSLLRKSAIEKELRAFGVAPDDLPQVKALIEALSIASAQVTQTRARQFYDDAYSLLTDVKASSNRNNEYLAMYLRRFAEHAIRHAGLNVDEKHIGGIVDRIPPMNELESEKDND
jgi:hypothetical protein